MRRALRKMLTSHLRELAGIWVATSLLVGGIFWLTLHFVQPAPPSQVVIAAATKGSPYYALAERYREALNQDGVTLDIVETSGSPENLDRLQKRTSDAAFVQGGIATGKDAPRLRSLGRVMHEPLWIFQRAGLALERLSDLKGRRVLVGPAGGGTNLLAMRLLEASGVAAGTATLVNMELPDYVEALATGKAEVGFLVLAANAQTVQRLFASPGVHLMNLVQADAYAQRFPFLTRLDLKQGIVDFARNIPPTDTAMVATMTSFVVRDDIHPAIANLLTQAIIATQAAPVVDSKGEAGLFDAASVFPIKSDPAFRLADEARRVYRDGPPLLQRFMPFWVATLLDRMIVMAIPIFGVLLPAVRFAPMVYNWRVRRRVVYWYKKLKTIEEGVDERRGSDTLRQKLDELERMEQAVNHVAVPLGFANQLYDLRQHIDVVRRRLSLKIP